MAYAAFTASRTLQFQATANAVIMNNYITQGLLLNFFDRAAMIGVNADITRNLQTFFHDLFGR